MKMYRAENTQRLLRVILLVEIFTNVKRFDFFNFIRVCELLNKAKKMRKFCNILFPWGAFCFILV